MTTTEHAPTGWGHNPPAAPPRRLRLDRRWLRIGFGVLGLLTLAAVPVRAQKGMPMTPERLTSLTQGRKLILRARTMSMSQISPNVTQQMMYRVRVAPEAADFALSVFCRDARLSDFEHAVTSLFGYRLIGRSQGEGMGLLLIQDPKAMAQADRQRLQGRAAFEAGINRALAWMKQPRALPEIVRTRCPAATALQDPRVKRAFTLHAALTKKQRDSVMTGHPVTLLYSALPPASRALLKDVKPAPRWVTFYLYDHPWSADSHPQLAVRAEPSGQTWLSCPPLALAPAHSTLPPQVRAALQTRPKGAPDMEYLEPGEEAAAIMEWLADEGRLWIMAEKLPSVPGGAGVLAKLGASFQGLTLEEALDRVAAIFHASWRYDDGWILFQRRATESLTRHPSSVPTLQLGRG